MRMPISPLAFVASALLLIENSYGESFRNDSPREVFRLDEVEYSELITTTVSRNVRLSFVLDNVRREKVVLDLERNDDLYLNPIVVHHLASDGSVQSIDTVPAGSNLAFRGTAYLEQQERGGKPETWPTAGWARMFFFVQDGQQLGGAGAFIINGFEYHVMTDSAYRKTQSAGEPDMPMQSEGPYLIAWRELAEKPTERHELRRRQQENATCSITELDFNKIYLDPTVVDPDLTRRQNRGLDSLDLGSLVQSTPKCPMSRQIALLGVATDCDYTAQFNSTNELRQHVLSVVNTASGMYERSFNISLKLQNLTVSDRDCTSGGAGGSRSPAWNTGCSSDVGILNRLRLFSNWRSSMGADRNAVWSLFSACNSGSTVGIASLGTVCNGARGRSRDAPGANVVVKTRAEWQVLAHEMGHNFGAVHDCTADCNSNSGPSERCCPLDGRSCDARGRYMMNPSSTTSMTDFSPCSIALICTAMERNLVRTSCLSGNEDVVTISSGVCGNNIVEPGEQCDCGGPEGCGENSRCCNPTTCQFTPGAACDPSSDGCCTSQCQASGSGKVCRASIGPCDPEEVCNGSSGSCPDDVRLPDGQSCGDGSNGTTCATGQCTSRNMQCSLVLFNSTRQWGSVSSCDSNSCQMDCSLSINADSSRSSCQATGADFLDGTPCGGSGGKSLCYNGECRRGSGGGGNSLSSWIDENKAIFVVALVVASFATLAAAWCCFASVRQRFKSARSRRAETRRQAGIAAPLRGDPHMQTNAGDAGGIPAHMQVPRPEAVPASRLSRSQTATHRYA